MLVLLWSSRCLNRPRSSWNLCMKNLCWTSSSSTLVCMNTVSLSALCYVSVSSSSHCGPTCSTAEPLWLRTSDEGRLRLMSVVVGLCQVSREICHVFFHFWTLFSSVFDVKMILCDLAHTMILNYLKHCERFLVLQHFNHLFCIIGFCFPVSLMSHR